MPRVVLMSPSRAELANEYGVLMGGTPDNRVSAATPEIRVRNRELADPTIGRNPIRFASIAGDYFVAVSLDGNKTNLLRTLLPIQVNLAVDGEPAGLPMYPSPTPTPPPSATTGPATTDPGSPGPGVAVAAAVIGGILAVLLVAGGVTMVILRRRHSHS